ncbi:MAG: endolytic transglycosylase MltG, partial [Clostridia bacterium]|nr:endolytic transglycosylase MltG [Clostridia bacterium]
LIAIDDPYNTYLYEGLPPGPICSPSISSIEAILYYEEHDYYFYVVSKDNPKSHVFSSTSEEHLYAVEENMS